jgi:hypothetical protein
VNEDAHLDDFGDVGDDGHDDTWLLDDEVCVDGDGNEHPEHDWKPGDFECRRCGADLSEWNENEEL